MKSRLAVIASGSGTTLQNLIDRAHDGRLDATVELVVSENRDSGALERGRSAGIASDHLAWRRGEVAAFSEELFSLCRHHRCDLVVLAGFLKLLHVPPDFHGRVVNVHPSLIPAFCGKGYFGHHVHQAVIDSGVKLTGCTVHFCDNEYDHGPIILQRGVPVRDDDTVETLAHRVQEAEREALPEAINLIHRGRVKLEGRRVRILPPSE